MRLAVRKGVRRNIVLSAILLLPLAAGCKHTSGAGHSSGGSGGSIGRMMGSSSSSSHSSSSFASPSFHSSASYASPIRSSPSYASASTSYASSSHSSASSLPSFAPIFHDTPKPASAKPSALPRGEVHHRERFHRERAYEGGGGDLVIVEPWIDITPAPESSDIPAWPAADAPSPTSDIGRELELAGVLFNEWSDAQPGDRGVAIGGITPESAADQAGLSAGDVILAVGSTSTPGAMESVSTTRDLGAIPISPGHAFLVRYLRAGVQNTLRLEVP
jgi:hypothetical protein